jgi:hypothetical protein
MKKARHARPQRSQRSVAATKIQTPDTRPQTSDRKANHRGHRERNAESTEILEILVKGRTEINSFSVSSAPKRFFQEALARVAHPVIPAKAGIQNSLKVLHSGSPPAFAGVARNDDYKNLFS